VIESQKDVRNLYAPGYVWPRFDAAFLEMLEKKTSAPAPRFLTPFCKQLLTERNSNKRLAAAANHELSIIYSGRTGYVISALLKAGRSLRGLLRRLGMLQ
jgi:hypothetical protein